MVIIYVMCFYDFLNFQLVYMKLMLLKVVLSEIGFYSYLLGAS